jgi:arylformamidase
MTELIDPFRIRAHVADFERLSAGYASASDHTRTHLSAELDLAYGGHPDEKLDLFFPPVRQPNMPVHLFVHGGYWRANTKADYAFLAEPIVAADAIAAIMDYSLMPAARMAKLVDQVRRAAAWLAANAARFGGDGAALSASGQSAGAHLVSYLAAKAPHETHLPKTPVRSLLLVSGIYDLGPITRSFLQAEIGLTQDEVMQWSPEEAQQSPATRLTLAVGADETEPFQIQQQDLAFAAAARGAPVERVTLHHLNHMTILTAMGTPGTPMAELLVNCIAQSRR